MIMLRMILRIVSIYPEDNNIEDRTAEVNVNRYINDNIMGDINDNIVEYQCKY
jgi:hypothetical protein